MLYDVSVVIPTLGEEHILQTIKYLNNSSVKPYEIILCIPDSIAYKVNHIVDKNVKLLETKRFGQVYQRAEGFKCAKSDYVLQLDDDILIEERCIEILVKLISSMKDESAVAPTLLEKKSKKNVYYKNINNLFIKIYYWLINGNNGYKPGTITKAGTCIGINTDLINEKLSQTQWLAGGCILHKKDNLILNDYYPFKEKAYSEDLIHSYYLSKKFIRLFVAKDAKCYVDTEIKHHKKSLSEFFKWLILDFKARNYFLNLLSKNKFHMIIYYLKEILLFICMKVLSLIKVIK